MKKFVFMICSLLAGVVLVSCEKDEVGGTATESMAGDWYVIVDCLDENGDVVIEDFNEGRFHILTYNTADNAADKLFVDDQLNLLGMKALTECNQNLKTETLQNGNTMSFMSFATKDTVDNVTSHSQYVSDRVIVTDGKIIKNGGHQNNGSVTDSISFYFEYTEDAYANAYNYKRYHVHGVRYSGLVEND